MKHSDIDAAVEWLRETMLANTEDIGGHPPLICRVESHVVIAGADHDDEPTLEVYCGTAVVKWRQDALGSLELDPDWPDNMVDAMWETAPNQCSCESIPAEVS